MSNTDWWRPLAQLLRSITTRGFCQAVIRRLGLSEDRPQAWLAGTAPMPAAAVRAVCTELPEEKGRRLTYAIIPSRYLLFDLAHRCVTLGEPGAYGTRFDELFPLFASPAYEAIHGRAVPVPDGYRGCVREFIRQKARDVAGFILGWADAAADRAPCACCAGRVEHRRVA